MKEKHPERNPGKNDFIRKVDLLMKEGQSEIIYYKLEIAKQIQKIDEHKSYVMVLLDYIVSLPLISCAENIPAKNIHIARSIAQLQPNEDKLERLKALGNHKRKEMTYLLNTVKRAYDAICEQSVIYNELETKKEDMKNSRIVTVDLWKTYETNLKTFVRDIRHFANLFDMEHYNLAKVKDKLLAKLNVTNSKRGMNVQQNAQRFSSPPCLVEMKAESEEAEKKKLEETIIILKNELYQLDSTEKVFGNPQDPDGAKTRRIHSEIQRCNKELEKFEKCKEIHIPNDEFEIKVELEV